MRRRGKNEDGGEMKIAITVLFAITIISASAVSVFAGNNVVPSRAPILGGPVMGAPGPIVGAGLPFLAIGYGVYWLIRRRKSHT